MNYTDAERQRIRSELEAVGEFAERWWLPHLVCAPTCAPNLPLHRSVQVADLYQVDWSIFEPPIRECEHPTYDPYEDPYEYIPCDCRHCSVKDTPRNVLTLVHALIHTRGSHREYSGEASRTAFESAAASATDVDTVIMLCTRHSGKPGIVDVRDECRSRSFLPPPARICAPILPVRIMPCVSGWSHDGRGARAHRGVISGYDGPRSRASRRQWRLDARRSALFLSHSRPCNRGCRTKK